MFFDKKIKEILRNIKILSVFIFFIVDNMLLNKYNMVFKNLCIIFLVKYLKMCEKEIAITF